MSRFRSRNVFINLDAVGFEGGEEIIELLSGVVFSRECSIYFVSEQITAFLTDGDKVANLIVLFLGHEHEGFSPSSHCRIRLSLPPNPAAHTDIERAPER